MGFKIIPFEPTYSKGNVSIMDIDVTAPAQVRFNRETREISIKATDEVDYQDMSWRELKKLVIKKGGIYKNKETSIEFLSGG